MSAQAFTRSLALFFLAALSVSVLPASKGLAQIPADFNGDGAVNGADLPLFAACMGGPNATPSAECAAACPPDENDHIGLNPALNMQAAAARSAGCVKWSSAAGTRDFPLPGGSVRGYANITAFYPGDLLYGVSAVIDGYHRPTLCLQPTGTSTAFSMRWVTLVGNGLAGTWQLQTGVATYRRLGVPVPPASNVVRTHPFLESVGADAASTYRLRIDTTLVPSGSHTYEVHWEPSFGSPRAIFYRGQDNRTWFVLDSPSDHLSRSPGYVVQFSGETYNTADKMAGTYINPCKIVDCQWEAGVQGNWVPLQFGPFDLSLIPAYLFDGQLRGSDGFEFWDWY